MPALSPQIAWVIIYINHSLCWGRKTLKHPDEKKSQEEPSYGGDAHPLKYVSLETEFESHDLNLYRLTWIIALNILNMA